jgi:hypothetical protein
MLSRGSNPKKRRKSQKEKKEKKKNFKASLSCLQNEKKTWLGLSQPVKKKEGADAGNTTLPRVAMTGGWEEGKCMLE